MKLKFKNQDFQTEAVNAVVDLFTGQEKTRSTFSVVEEKQLTLLNDLGIGNALYIDENTITDNMHTIQKRNRLPMTKNASDMQFCIKAWGLFKKSFSRPLRVKIRFTVDGVRRVSSLIAVN